MPPPPPSDNLEAQGSQIEGVPLGDVYIHTALPNPQLFNLDPYAKDHKGDKDYITDLLTDGGTSTG